MVVLQLDWQQSALLTAALLVVAALLFRAGRPRARALAPWVREAAVVAALYGLWQFAAARALQRTDGAFARAAAAERWERRLGLPSERDLQDPLLGHRGLAHVAVYFYDVAHFTVMGLFLVWLFWRHRDRYPALRTWLATVTALCLVVQLFPVAPPRLMPGFADVAERVGLSVYASGGFGADQLSAMPSVHVAWSLLVGIGVVIASSRRWRWIALAHPLVTVWVVVATANHWWLDGIVAAGLLIVCGAVQYAVMLTLRRRGPQHEVAAGRPEDLAAV